jgi:antitoxin (DNA-binding transcriptional repressor) of toxin-antitoxin stability system
VKTASVSSVKNHLSACLAQVKAGESFLITDRNRGVALLSPLGGHGMDEKIEKLVSKGIIRTSGTAPDTEVFFSLPLPVCTEPLSSVVFEERDGR